MTDEKSKYAQAGVNIDAGQKAVDLMKDAVRATYTPDVLSDTGNFGGLFAATHLQTMQQPVLVASTDGVGTKTRVAARMNQWDSIGNDLVNHCVNDILVQGAKPLFFLDYVASDALVPEQIAAIVTGMAQACTEAGCALLGGETAEMPGVYAAGEVDVVGTIVGAVDRDTLLDGSRIQPGDVLIGLAASGLHTNGFTLARAALDRFDWSEARDELNGQSIGETFLNVHRSYLRDIERLRAHQIDIRGLAHITGGGIVDNLPRILPDHASGAIIERGTWPILPIFKMIQEAADVCTDEMYRVFNMGLGMLVIVPPEQVTTVTTCLPDMSYVVGQITDTPGIQFEDVTR